MRPVRIGVTQASWQGDISTKDAIDEGIEKMIQKHERLTAEAADKKVNILGFQELFFGPYFCAEQDTRWYDYAESIPGPLTERMSKLAKKQNMILVVPMYEEEQPGFLYNTTVIIDEKGTILGKYRKNHIPHQPKGYWEKFYFRPSNIGYPIFETKYGKIAVYTCYDRHFPEGARILGLKGAEIVFNPSATTSGHSDHLWTLEQSAHAVANGYFVAANNRVGDEPWGFGTFYGSSYVVDPKGNILAQGSREKDEIVIADIDLDMCREVRNYWPFFRDRRPETYDQITDL
ncbi:MAG: acyltransferase [Candidatus Lokiarchaeota archaeon]|nr:acyltransferase [Candidatus Lokiarchaeota archaeon]